MALCCYYSSAAQEDSIKTPKIFDTWISFNNQSKGLKGVLYEIRDSSILVSNSSLKADYLTGDFKVSNIDFKNIDYVSVRKKNRVLTGTIVGSVVGLATAVGFVRSAGGIDEFGGIIMLLYGTPAIALGAGIGALASSFRIKIPINGSFENFKSNERRLERYSYLNEYSNSMNIYEKAYEHKWFIGLIGGLSIPSGDFEHSIQNNTDEDFPKLGGNTDFILGYSFKQNYGISASYLNSSYNFKNSSTDTWWSVSSVLAGPMLSFPVKNSLYLDLKPMIGSTSASLNTDDSNEISGNGFSMYPCISIRYNFSIRLCALVETGYLFSTQKFEDGNKKIQTTNLSAGIAYRFR